MQEGQIWEAIMLAPKLKLGNLCCILDKNGSQNDGYVKDILDLGTVSKKVREFGWRTVDIDGHIDRDLDLAIMAEFNDVHSLQCEPTFVVAHTIKGHPIPFMKTPEWHAKVPNEEEYFRAYEELSYESD